MSQAATAIPAHHAHEEHEHGGFISTYIFSLDHKMIAKQFLFMALFMFIIGGLLALLVRFELAWPEKPDIRRYLAEIYAPSDGTAI